MRKINGTRSEVFELNTLAKPRSSQQEIVGFVLIVALVMIALMIFLVISIKKPVEEKKDFQVENMLKTIMSETTECAPVYVPQYYSVEDLIKGCYDNEKCTNLNKMACEYLNESLVGIMGEVMDTETQISAYQMNVYFASNESREELIEPIMLGNCTGEIRGAPFEIAEDEGNLVAYLRFCYG